MSKSDNADVLLYCATVLYVCFHGNPDLIDALIYIFLMKG